ncbi:MAG: IPExxxVDY family protein [Bacteroidota bacterium]
MADKKIKNEISVDYQLIGIASSLREYKLCYHLNLILGCDFRKLKDLFFGSTERTRTVQFSVFKAGEEEHLNKFIIFTNKSLGEVLLPEVSNFDYIVQVHGNYEAEDIDRLINEVRKLPEVMMTAVIPLKKIKSKERLIYEEERPSQRLINTKRFK